jgi:hypothetical protein
MPASERALTDCSCCPLLPAFRLAHTHTTLDLPTYSLFQVNRRQNNKVKSSNKANVKFESIGKIRKVAQLIQTCLQTPQFAFSCCSFAIRRSFGRHFPRLIPLFIDGQSFDTCLLNGSPPRSAEYLFESCLEFPITHTVHTVQLSECRFSLHGLNLAYFC